MSRPFMFISGWCAGMVVYALSAGQPLWAALNGLVAVAAFYRGVES